MLYLDSLHAMDGNPITSSKEHCNHKEIPDIKIMIIYGNKSECVFVCVYIPQVAALWWLTSVPLCYLS